MDRTDTQARPVLDAVPDGRLAIIPTSSFAEIGKKVDRFLVDWRKGRVTSGALSGENGYSRDSFIIEAKTPRFGSGEGKGTISQSVRGDDVYILVDVMNHSLSYQMAGFENSMSPDDHFQDLKRIIGAAGKKARRLNVIMPYLYEGRRIHQSGRESLDCANALQELVAMGVDNIITFDAHDARVQNAIPDAGFETVSPTYQFIKNLLRYVPDIKLSSDELMVVSPDEGGMGRAIYLANVLGIDMGMFFKRHDYTIRNEDGSSPILENAFLGPAVEGKDVIIIDDMISSGDHVLETASLLKKKNARRVFICATFGIMTQGVAPFDKAYEQGLFDKLITTNLIYQPEELLSRDYYINCDMSKYIALIIDTLNHDCSLAPLLNPVDRINKVLDKYSRHEKI